MARSGRNIQCHECGANEKKAVLTLEELEPAFVAAATADLLRGVADMDIDLDISSESLLESS
jgi:hypothetical protein